MTNDSMVSAYLPQSIILDKNYLILLTFANRITSDIVYTDMDIMTC